MNIIENKIYLIRGKKVMFDQDLAELYDVGTKVLNQAVKRNKNRFPADFMFRLNQKENKFWGKALFEVTIGALKFKVPNWHLKRIWRS